MDSSNLNQRVDNLEYQVEQLVKYNQELIRLLDDRLAISSYDYGRYIDCAQNIKELESEY